MSKIFWVRVEVIEPEYQTIELKAGDLVRQFFDQFRKRYNVPEGKTLYQVSPGWKLAYYYEEAPHFKGEVIVEQGEEVCRQYAALCELVLRFGGEDNGKR